MTRISCEEPSVFTTNGNHDERSSGEPRIRWSRDFLNGGYASGETLELREFANDHGFDFDSAPTALADLDTLGMVTRTHSNSAFVGSPYPKDMQVAGEIREALEEIGDREAAPRFKGNSAEVERELDAAQVAISDRWGRAPRKPRFLMPTPNGQASC